MAKQTKYSNEWSRRTDQRRAAEVAPASRPEQYPFIPLKQTKDDRADIDHLLYPYVLQYEIYIPAKVWTHRAVIAFKNELATNIPGATIIKTVIGQWQGMEEDTNIYRAIVFPRESNAELTIRPWLQDEIGKMMAILAEWGESRQFEVMFTETIMAGNRSILKSPVDDFAPRDPIPLAKDDQ